MKIKDSYQKEIDRGWYRVFAWFPIHTSTEGWLWLEWYEQQCIGASYSPTNGVSSGWQYAYRQWNGDYYHEFFL